MQNVLIRHTAELEAADLAAVRTLCNAAFGADFTDSDYEHALGGVHALRFDGDRLVAHAALVGRRILHGGRALRTGYVEGVAVRADRRRRGHGDAVMAELERVIRFAYHLGALGASPLGSHLYAARGWQLWQGPSSALTPDGIRRTANHDGAVYVLPVSVPLDLTAELTCDYRPAAPW